ncbi:GxxExxY protein [Runella limosa]|jgi:GxxExxY protein|uniref:GxxExxY protein n=1 Tax=Runella limosa TaxID=370978 RepID=UPI0003F8A571|nr:GxxExxY protein [Runella limosa]
MITKKAINDLSYEIIGAAIEVHKVLGPGLLESNYEKALIHELSLRGLRTKSQQIIQVPYKEILLDCELRYDILVEDLVLVENKAVLEIHPIFEATLLTYMKHLKIPKGICANR